MCTRRWRLHDHPRQQFHNDTTHLDLVPAPFPDKRKTKNHSLLTRSPKHAPPWPALILPG
jgi:hypothetical protein